MQFISGGATSSIFTASHNRSQWYSWWGYSNLWSPLGLWYSFDGFKHNFFRNSPSIIQSCQMSRGRCSHSGSAAFSRRSRFGVVLRGFWFNHVICSTLSGTSPKIWHALENGWYRGNGHYATCINVIELWRSTKMRCIFKRQVWEEEFGLKHWASFVTLLPGTKRAGCNFFVFLSMLWMRVRNEEVVWEYYSIFINNGEDGSL